MRKSKQKEKGIKSKKVTGSSRAARISGWMQMNLNDLLGPHAKHVAKYDSTKSVR